MEYNQCQVKTFSLAKVLYNEIPSKMVEGPKSSMHAIVDKVDQIKKKNVPGPGNYDL